VVFCGLLQGTASCEQVFTLQDVIREALQVNLQVKISQEEKASAIAQQKVQRSNFFPSLSAQYRYVRNDEEFFRRGFGIIRPEEEYDFSTGFSQPLFTGFALINQYKLAQLGVNAAELSEDLSRQDVVVSAKRDYFTVLKNKKLLNVAVETVGQIEAQRVVAENFYNVGMTPLNDLLEVEVFLANANQLLIVAENDLASAEAQLNTLLRRPVNSAVLIEDILEHVPVDRSIDECLSAAVSNRIELKLADLEIQNAEKQLELARKDYYPTVSLEGRYTQTGTDWTADKGLSDFDDPYRWDITAVARWDFWQWGKTYYGVDSRLRKKYQAEIRKKELTDQIHLEVKRAYLKTIETERNIVNSEKAIEQAKENLRINQERYTQQVATSTEVLDAQTLLTRTEAIYYSALYDYKIAKAFLYRAMGLAEAVEEALQ
jgi:outer membrane protein TolC